MKRLLLALLLLIPLYLPAQAELVLRQSTASQAVLIGPFVDSTDGDTAETGLTIDAADVRISVNGGNTVGKNSGGCTHDELGMYACTFDATDTATVGRMQVYVKETGALIVYHEFQVAEEAVYDACCAASAAPLTAAAVWANGTRTLTALDEDDTTIDLNASTVGTVTTATNVTTVNGLAANVITAAATAADFGTEIGTATWATTTRSLTILDEDSTTLDLNGTAVGSITSVTNILTGLRDTVIEDQGSVTWGCAMAVLLAGVAGDLDVTGSSGVFEDPTGTETRITYTLSSGDRAVTITCPSY